MYLDRVALEDSGAITSSTPSNTDGGNSQLWVLNGEFPANVLTWNIRRVRQLLARNRDGHHHAYCYENILTHYSTFAPPILLEDGDPISR